MNFLKKLFGILPIQYASAHCDVPCGIYDPKPAQIAAKTVLTMVQKIIALEKNGDDKVAKLEYKNSLMRMIWTKEEHARICKEQILILWTDYFNPEHLEMFSDLHDTIWRAAKLCSQNKQHVDEKLAQELVESVDHIAEMFEKSKAPK